MDCREYDCVAVTNDDSSLRSDRRASRSQNIFLNLGGLKEKQELRSSDQSEFPNAAIVGSSLTKVTMCGVYRKSLSYTRARQVADPESTI